MKEFMLTAKDVLYIEDCLGQTEALYKRLTHEITLLEDKDIKKECETCNQKLEKHFETLVYLLKQEVHNA